MPGTTLSRRFRAHADSLVQGGRSPLYVALMRGAADDIEGGGVVAELFDGLAVAPGSVPQLRLLSALHELVLTGGAAELTPFYPSAGGDRPPDDVWPEGRRALAAHFDWIRERLPRTVQTNEPGRSAVLYAVLLWLTARYGRPIRLLEIGASAGLNLNADRYRYLVDGSVLGDPTSAVGFDHPWRPPPAVDLVACARELQISHRGGCDLSPLNVTRAEDRLRLLSYIWPDEPARLARLDAALAIAARDVPPVTAGTASRWLPEQLDRRHPDELTVVWHSVMRQYVGDGEWARVEAGLATAAEADPGPVVRVGMEPGPDHTLGFEVTLHGGHGAPPELLARCGDHGPPVIWESHAG